MLLHFDTKKEKRNHSWVTILVCKYVETAELQATQLQNISFIPSRSRKV